MRNLIKTALIVGSLTSSMIVMADTPKKDAPAAKDAPKADAKKDATPAKDAKDAPKADAKKDAKMTDADKKSDDLTKTPAKKDAPKPATK